MKKQVLIFISFFTFLQSFAQEFITTWKTDNSGTSSPTSITIPTSTGESYEYDIDWDNDGTYNFADVKKTGSVTHDFGTPGTYTIRIRGKFPRIYFNNSGDKEKLIEVNQWGDIGWTSMEAAFFGCSNLNITATDAPNLSSANNLENMFASASSLNANFRNWNTSSIINMKSMFKSASSFNGDIGNWNTSNVTSMESMFHGATSFNVNIQNWNTSSVINMKNMFNGAELFNQNIQNWLLTSAENLNSMFFGTILFNQDLGSWNVENVMDFENMFKNVSLSQTNYQNILISWNGQNLKPNINIDFGKSSFCSEQAKQAKQNMISSKNWTILDWGEDCGPNTYFKTIWKTDNLTAGSSSSTSVRIPTFPGETYNYDVDWNNDGVFDDFGVSGNIEHNYGTAGTYTINIKGNFPRIYINGSGTADQNKILSVEQWGDIEWSSFGSAFNGASSFEINATDTPDLSRVTDMSNAFRVASFVFLGNNMENWDTSNVINMNSMFRLAYEFNGDISAWDTSKVTDMNSMFNNALKFDQDLSGWNVESVTNFDFMFRNAKLSTVNYDKLLVGWSTQNLITGRTFRVGNSQYCSNSAVAARNSIINTSGWTIVDGGKNCSGIYFVTKWKTDNPGNSSSTSITIPTFSGATYNYDIDWNNDGVFDDIGVTSDITHDYGTAGTYTVNIQGQFPRIYFNFSGDKDKILSVEDWGIIDWESMEYAFAGATNFNLLARNNPRLNKVSSLKGMFSGVTSLFVNINTSINGWNTLNITDMSEMFSGCLNFKGELDSWNTSNVNNMSQMFKGASDFNQNISGWDTSEVTDMSEMFMQTSDFNQDISNWDTSKVTDMIGMFNLASNFNQNIGNWNTLNVTNMSQMFRGNPYFNANIGSWDVSKVVNMSQMFLGSLAFNQNIGGWNTSSVTNMSQMFYNAIAFNEDINSWDVSNVLDMTQLFRSTPSFNQNLSSWDTSKVTTMYGMFRESAFNQDVSSWNISSLTSIQQMFALNTVFNQDLSSWNTSNIVNMNSVFSGATAFDQDISSWNVENVVDFTNLFFNTSISDTNYDALLIGWDAQNLKPNLSFHGGNSKYCSAAAEMARNNMINSDGWTVIDGGGCAALSVYDFELNKVTLFPNPSKTEILINGLTELTNITIYDITGKNVLTIENYLDKTIDINALKTGIYIVKIAARTSSKTLKLLIN